MQKPQLSPIEQSLRTYAIALQQLEAIAPTYTEAEILEVLSARNTLRSVLAQQSGTYIPSATLHQVLDLDERLRSHAAAIAQYGDLEAWCESLEPADTAWWWRFQRPPHPLERLDWLWSALTMACLTASVSILVALGMRFLSQKPDVASFFMFLTPSLMTLAAGGALTRAGRETLEHGLSRLGLSKHWWHEVKFALALVLLIALMTFYALLPQLSRIYDNLGLQLWKEGNFSMAIARYTRSLQLDPSNARTRFHLGRLYEDLGQLEEAMMEYQLATQAGFLEAYPPLARLYILTDQPERAVQLLLPMEPLIEDETVDVEIRYGIATNLGWARLEQERWAEAEGYLRRAVDIANISEVEDPGASICLLAQAMDAQGQPEAMAVWRACAEHGNPMASPEEDAWVREAQTKVGNAASRTAP